MIEERQKVDGCHCGGRTIPYRTRSFQNTLGRTVTKIFHKCEDCGSRFVGYDYGFIDHVKRVLVSSYFCK